MSDFRTHRSIGDFNFTRKTNGTIDFVDRYGTDAATPIAVRDSS